MPVPREPVELIGPEGGCKVEGTDGKYVCLSFDHITVIGEFIERAMEWMFFYSEKCGPETVPTREANAADSPSDSGA